MFTVLYYTILCTCMYMCQRSGGTYCFHLQGSSRSVTVFGLLCWKLCSKMWAFSSASLYERQPRVAEDRIKSTELISCRAVFVRVILLTWKKNFSSEK